MQIEKAALPLNNLIRDYKNQDTYIMKYFDYPPFAGSFENRAKDLAQRTFNRAGLADTLLELNKRWQAPTQTIQNIERLRATDSMVVIGGQQAGLLTGPLYTVNKVISLIQLARQQAAELGKPVIPVFWIAGEDHDFEEVNHVYMPAGSQLKKHKIGHYINEKRSVTYIEKDAEKSKIWLDEVFAALPETERTKNLYDTVKRCLNESTTYVDFFAKLIFLIFKDSGVVLLDSADPEIRALEKPYFKKMIQSQPSIAATVHQAKETLQQAGYPIALDTAPTDGNLFLQHNGERILLQCLEPGQWTGKQGELRISTEALLEIAETEPARLSNNVVTRPLMQECLFPTLAFIGGNGEIAYWAALKGAFHALDMKMPPVLPRLSFTFSDKRLEKTIAKLALTQQEVMENGTAGRKANWLKSQVNPPLDSMVALLKQTITDAHAPLKETAAAIRSDIGQLAETNIERIQNEIDFLHGKMMQAVEQKHEQVLTAFDYAEMVLLPFGGLQERAWTPLSFINEHGTSFIRELTHVDCVFTEDHYIVHI